MVREPFLMLLIKLKVLEEDLVSSSVKSSESTQDSEPDNWPKPNVMVLPTSSTIQKDTESQDGSSTDKRITRKERTSKSLLTSFKPNSEKTSKDCTRWDVTRVLDTNGDLRSEVNTPRPPVEEEKLSVSKERKNDLLYVGLNLNLSFLLNVLFKWQKKANIILLKKNLIWEKIIKNEVYNFYWYFQW